MSKRRHNPKGRLVFGDLLLAIGFVKAKKGEKVFDSLRRQGEEIRRGRKKAFEEAIRRNK